MKKENVQTACQILAWLSIIGGIILGIYLAYKLGVDINTSSYLYTVRTERNTLKTVLYFILGFGTGFIEYILFMALYHVLNNQSEMLYMIQKLYNVDSKTSISVNSNDQELPPL